MLIALSKRPWLWGILTIWLGLVGAGLAGLWRYAQTPGETATAPGQWPPAASTARVEGRPTLIVFAHPQCACSQATIGELAILVAHAPQPIDIHVLFYRPVSEPDGWERGSLWEAAAEIPGVRVATDVGGVEATRFGAQVSGQTLLFEGSGRLAFNGGITGARGHQGDNPGRSALTLLLNHKAPQADTTHVFGCLLHDAPAL